MDVFFSLLSKITPLYLLIFLGFISGRYLEVKGVNIAKLMFFIVTPFIVLEGTWKTPITPQALSLPFIFYGISAALTLLFYTIGKGLWGDTRANALGLMSGTGNTGYFGIPIAMIIFPEELLGLYILPVLGLSLSELTIGYFLAAKSQFSPRESFKKVATLPALYAFIVGATLGGQEAPVPEPIQLFFTNMRGAYTVLGMMLIGFGISALKNFKVDFSFLATASAGKFLAWPLAIFMLIFLDTHYMYLFTPAIHMTWILLAIVLMRRTAL